MHANNIFLYGAGAASNLICHILVSIMNADEPSFFEGYGSFGAIMVIVNNVFIGLAINAVYKCMTSPPRRLKPDRADNLYRRRCYCQMSSDSLRNRHLDFPLSHLFRLGFQPSHLTRCDSCVRGIMVIRIEPQNQAQQHDRNQEAANMALLQLQVSSKSLSGILPRGSRFHASCRCCHEHTRSRVVSRYAGSYVLGRRCY